MGKLRNNKDGLFTVKTGEHTPIEFVWAFYYLESVGCENEYFCYFGEHF